MQLVFHVLKPGTQHLKVAPSKDDTYTMNDELTDEQAAKIATKVHDAYKDRIQAYLNSLRDELKRLGWDVTEVYDRTDESYAYCFGAAGDGAKIGDESAIDITFEIPEAIHYGDDPGGLSFGVQAVEFGGIIIGGIQPYNFTDLCWVDGTDEGAVEDRFRLIETEGSLWTWTNLLENHLNQKAASNG